MLTDARFSGVSTGACIGHVGPEALAGGPIGKAARRRPASRSSSTATGWRARVDLVGADGVDLRRRRKGRACSRPGAPRPDLAPDPDLPDDTRLWAALQHVGGGTWGGCVYDVDAIVHALSTRPPLPSGERAG